MKNGNKKTIKVIELFGFPGSGKSTISNKFVKYLNDNNISVIEPKRKIDKELSSFNRYLIKTLYSIKSLFIFNKKVVPLLLQIAKINKGITLIKQVINILYTLSFYNHSSIVVLDEGIIQSIVSSAYKSSLSETIKLFNLLPNFVKENSIFIYVNVDTEICMRRLLKREDGKSRLDKISDPIELKKDLNYLDDNFKEIKKYIEFYNIDNSFKITENDIRDIATIILDKLYKEGG